jgi:hypothetical protein
MLSLPKEVLTVAIARRQCLAQGRRSLIPVKECAGPAWRCCWQALERAGTLAVGFACLQTPV